MENSKSIEEDSETKWVYLDSQGVQGPFSTDQIKALLVKNDINGSTSICREGDTAWLKIENLTVFQVASKTGTERKLPPLPSTSDHPKGCGSSLKVLSVGVAGVVLLAALGLALRSRAARIPSRNVRST